jgi:hypothetical protein
MLTVRLFTTRPIKYRDENGRQCSAGKCVDHDLPAAVAERALKSGACVKLDNPSRATNLGNWPGNYSLAACFDLDAAEAAAPTATSPVVHSAFEVVDRGPAFKLRVATGGAS